VLGCVLFDFDMCNVESEPAADDPEETLEISFGGRPLADVEQTFCGLA